MAPGAPLHTLDGTAVDIKSYFGKKPVVLEFWATWCPLCKQLEPAMKGLFLFDTDGVAYKAFASPHTS